MKIGYFYLSQDFAAITQIVELEKYTNLAGIERSISPHKLRHFLFTWLKKKNIDDAFIQLYSGLAKGTRWKFIQN